MFTGQSCQRSIQHWVPPWLTCTQRCTQRIQTLGLFLAEMWHKMCQESQRGNNSSRAGTPLPRQQGSPLADPPAVKAMVRAEVKMLLQTLRERASRGGRDDDELLFWYKPETVDYALGHLDSCYRNCTNYKDIHNGRPSSHCSVQSNAEDEIESMSDKLNVADIDQVVDRLKSVLMEECEALNRLVMHFKGNIKQKCQRQFEKSEPSLAELRELRGAVQMDLELYPSSFAASPPASSPLPLKWLKNKFRLSAGQRVSDETPQVLSTTSVLRPHPPPPLWHTKPRPPLGAPPSKTASSAKLINSSPLPSTCGQHRRTTSSSGPRKTQMPTASLPGPGSDQIIVETTHCCSLSPEQDSACLRCMTPTSNTAFQAKTPRNSPLYETHLSSIRSPSRKCDLSPKRERKGCSAWKSRNVNSIPSPALSSHCDAGSYSNNNTDHSGSTTVKSNTQNSTCGGSLVSTTVQTDSDRRKSTESYCVGSGESNIGIDINKSWEGCRPTAKPSSHCLTDRLSHHPESRDIQGQAKCTHPASIRINGQFFTFPKRPPEGTTSQPKSAKEAQPELGVYKQLLPAPPAKRVLT
ncbi:coiled-coil domain-containing protein 24 isoform X2 [Micropterus dolomieu]|uniref:coiled-coil domain-containing protein 24 isoform X2 n=1 Tax=Micropterus dolomieu TaxID=147949 RepID=UPI001E8D13EA|nr:coiled-coil domain-containing protein 24 isoform X2 [Micropterus dolomieu]